MTGVRGVVLDHMAKHVSRGHGAITVPRLAARLSLGEGIEPFVSQGDLGLPGWRRRPAPRRGQRPPREVPFLALVQPRPVSPALAARAGTRDSPPGLGDGPSRAGSRCWAASSGGRVGWRPAPRTSSRWSVGNCRDTLGRSPFHRPACRTSGVIFWAGPHVAHEPTQSHGGPQARPYVVARPSWAARQQGSPPANARSSATRTAPVPRTTTYEW